ncbi:uncharacterized protein ATC70_012953 [Mucor velutinosus]|uniref:WRKY domain-containing protein n=1 Tax=Mucor velutinosus TaxID=708070 RepID=A0AAN7HYA4_9FUNG|nr:hypothetical protein ATC70_012953 [Mucor velutinosus]
MNDFSFPSMSKDMSKVGGILYPTETPTFTRPNPINKANSFSQPQEYDQWRSNSLPSSVPMSLPNTTTMNNTNNNTGMNSNNNSSNPAINPVSCDLQDVIIYYQSQPELLRLILLSKVEEDKRRAEEAKLRAKELDLFLLQQQQQMNGTPQTPDASFTTTSSTPPALMSSSSNMMNSSSTTTATTTAASTPTITTTATHNLLNTNQFGQIPRRPSALEMLMDDSDCNRRDSALGSSFDGSANSEEIDDRTFSPHATSTAAASMLSMSFTAQPMVSARNSLHPLSPPYTLNTTNQPLEDTFSTQIKTNASSAEPPRRYDSYFPQRPRRRREMQAISKIVETRDYPYVDGFFWKNNGNTIQKKTGNKSVYYKCSNSSKGCPVNKTVTWKENGEYLIKYRGEHLAECGKVQRIVDM